MSVWKEVRQLKGNQTANNGFVSSFCWHLLFIYFFHFILLYFILLYFEREEVEKVSRSSQSFYLPGGSRCGGSSGPAWVASSWVLTPLRQSSRLRPAAAAARTARSSSTDLQRQEKQLSGSYPRVARLDSSVPGQPGPSAESSFTF